MKLRLAGLRFLIGDYLNIDILPGVGLSITHIFLRFVGLDFDLPQLDGFEELKLRFDVCHKNKVKWMHSFNGNPVNRRFCRETTRNKKSGVER
jgi:hypothetical protein